MNMSDKILDFELEKQRQKTIQAVREFEELGSHLQQEEAELSKYVGKLFQLEQEHARKNAQAIWELYLFSALSLAGYIAERYDLNEPKIMPMIAEIRGTLQKRFRVSSEQKGV